MKSLISLADRSKAERVGGEQRGDAFQVKQENWKY
jgi:hypothetical protein